MKLYQREKQITDSIRAAFPGDDIRAGNMQTAQVGGNFNFSSRTSMVLEIFAFSQNGFAEAV
jgi:hypothetical protein